MLGLLGLAVSAGAVPSVAAEDGRAQDRSVRDSMYTAAQAERGVKTFGQFCSGCHGPDRFTGDRIAPWAGQTADALFDAIRLKMPEDRPGTLTRQQFADILAYVFKLNGYPAGNSELSGTDEEMKAFRIEVP